MTVNRDKSKLSTIAWEGVWTGYAHKYISSIYWKFQRHMEREDLFSEAWIVFNTCYKKYVEDENSEVYEPAHFMSLYKTALYRHFNRMLRNTMTDATSHAVTEVVSSDGEDTHSPLDKISDTSNLRPDQVIALLDLPKPCLKFLEKHLSDEGIAVLRQGSMYKRSINAKRGDLFPRETTNEFYCRVVGVDPNDVNIREEFFKALRED